MRLGWVLGFSLYSKQVPCCTHSAIRFGVSCSHKILTFFLFVDLYITMWQKRLLLHHSLPTTTFTYAPLNVKLFLCFQSKCFFFENVCGLCVCLYICVCVLVYVRVCMCVCVYVLVWSGLTTDVLRSHVPLYAKPA